MKIAQLFLEPGSVGEAPEEWGSYAFIDMPAAGDRLTIERDGTSHTLAVVWIHHRPVAKLDAGGPVLGLPQAEIMMKLV